MLVRLSVFTRELQVANRFHIAQHKQQKIGDWNFSFLIRLRVEVVFFFRRALRTPRS